MCKGHYKIEDIQPLPKGGFFQLFPGVYCKACGEIFALYSYSVMQPDGVDEDGRAFYNTCGLNGCGK